MILLDITQGEDTKVIGDKGYDANKLIEKKIGKNKNKNKHLYKERHLIECFFTG